MEKQKGVCLRALKNTLPVMAGYLVLGAGFGILLRSKGLTTAHALLMSMFIYAGSMQFAALDLITSAASLPAIALTTLMVNARHLFYGISMTEKFRQTGLIKPYLIFALTDETYSLAVNEEGNDARYFGWISLIDHLWWITGTLIGALAGGLLTFDTTGMDFALTALFITIFTDKLSEKENRLPGSLGAAFSIICLLIFGRNSFLIPSMLVITVFLLIYTGRRNK